MDGLLQEDLPLDTSPVVSLNRVDHLDTQTNTRHNRGERLIINNDNIPSERKFQVHNFPLLQASAGLKVIFSPVYEASPGSSHWDKCFVCHQSPHSRPCSCPSSLGNPPGTDGTSQINMPDLSYLIYES